MRETQEAQSMDNETGNRYDSVNAAWAATGYPPATRDEVTRALAILCRKFGGTQYGSPAMLQPFRTKRVRVCWITRKGGSQWKGWARLAHDFSHMVFRARHPHLTPHHPSHVRVEREVTEFMLAAGWHTGALKREPVAPSLDEKRTARRANLAARLARWESKAKRAATAIRKIKRSLQSIDRRVATSAA